MKDCIVMQPSPPLVVDIINVHQNMQWIDLHIISAADAM